MQVYFKAGPYKPLLLDERNTKIDMKREQCKYSISSVAKAGKQMVLFLMSYKSVISSLENCSSVLVIILSHV